MNKYKKIDNDTYSAAIRVVSEASEIFPEKDLMDEAQIEIFNNSLNIISAYRLQQEEILFKKKEIIEENESVKNAKISKPILYKKQNKKSKPKLLENIKFAIYSCLVSGDIDGYLELLSEIGHTINKDKRQKLLNAVREGRKLYYARQLENSK